MTGGQRLGHYEIISRLGSGGIGEVYLAHDVTLHRRVALKLLPAQQPLTSYRKLNAFVRYPSWSPKGDQVVYEYSETTGNIWIAELK